MHQNAYFYFLFCFGLVQWVEGDVEDHFDALVEAEEKDLVRFVFWENLNFDERLSLWQIIVRV